MFGTWPPFGIVHSSTAPPGWQPLQRVTAASAGLPATLMSASTSTRSSTTAGSPQPSYRAHVATVFSAPG